MSFWRKLFGASEPAVVPASPAADRIARRSTGLQQFLQVALHGEGRRILDLGPTSPANIQFIAGLGHRLYNEDLLTAAKDSGLMAPGEAEHSGRLDSDAFFNQNLTYPPETFDAVLLWDLCDYLPEVLVKPAVDRLFTVTRPGGILLGLFHAKSAGADALYARYHIRDTETLELQTGAPFQLQRAFANRHIENLFHRYASIKFFLGKDNIHEVLIVR